MNINAATVITRYNGKPDMIDQEPATNELGQAIIINGIPQMTGGREMTVGDIFATILSTRKVEQFNVLKADVPARRFYRADIVDINGADCSALMEMIDHSDVFVPFVLAYAKRTLIEAREGKQAIQPGKNKNGRQNYMVS